MTNLISLTCKVYNNCQIYISSRNINLVRMSEIQLPTNITPRYTVFRVSENLPCKLSSFHLYLKY